MPLGCSVLRALFALQACKYQANSLTAKKAYFLCLSQLALLIEAPKGRCKATPILIRLHIASQRDRNWTTTVCKLIGQIAMITEAPWCPGESCSRMGCGIKTQIHPVGKG